MTETAALREPFALRVDDLLEIYERPTNDQASL